MNLAFATLPHIHLRHIRALASDARRRVAYDRAHTPSPHASDLDAGSAAPRSAALTAQWRFDPATGHLACRWLSDGDEAAELWGVTAASRDAAPASGAMTDELCLRRP